MNHRPAANTRAALVAALLAVISVFTWQALTVRYNYGGNWTALFCAGSQSPPPPDALAFEHVYRFPQSNGYDGQFYHYIAHDPFLRRDFSSAIDSPRMRYRRVLVSLIAWVLAFGRDRWIDPAYFAVLLCSVFLAAFWTSQIASDYDFHPGWGTAVLLVPAVAVSMDRMTVDAALVALLAGMVLYAQRSRWGMVWGLCVLACLVRESGMLIPAGILAWAATQRRFRLAALLATTPLPAFVWYAWVAQRTPAAEADFVSYIPFIGLLQRIATPSSYPFGILVNAIVTLFDYAALAGIGIAVLYAAARVRDLAKQPVGFIVFAFAALVAVISRADVWTDAFSFARVFSPLIFLVGIDALRTRTWAGALPLILIAPRIAISFVPQASHIARSVIGLS